MSIYKQIGNAVPVGLGYAAGNAIKNHREGIKKHHEIILNHSRYKEMSHFEFIPKFETKYVDKKSDQLNAFGEKRNLTKPLFTEGEVAF